MTTTKVKTSELVGWLLEYAKPILDNPERLLGAEPIRCPTPMCGCKPGICKIKESRQYADALELLEVVQ
jgi:hypothetical protein